jgi:hypothetical protein
VARSKGSPPPPRAKVPSSAKDPELTKDPEAVAEKLEKGMLIS